MFGSNKNAKKSHPKNGVTDVTHYNQKVEPVANKLIFSCQLAHGSPVLTISDFTTIQEMYQTIANTFAISEADVSNFSGLKISNGYFTS